jgi:putative membrane protein
VEDFATAIWAGLALGLLNAVLRPILVFFTLPATVITLGLFLLVINAFILYLVGALVAGVEIHGFGWAFLGALLISMISTLLYQFIGPEGSRVRIEIKR